MIKRSIVDIVFDAIEQGNALTIETRNRIFDDCAVLRTTDDHVVINTFDNIKDSMREFDIKWVDIIDAQPF